MNKKGVSDLDILDIIKGIAILVLVYIIIKTLTG